jgi:hypothetical protein
VIGGEELAVIGEYGAHLAENAVVEQLTDDNS